MRTLRQRLLGARARRRLRRDIGVWYRGEYGVPSLEKSARIRALNARRAERIAGALVSEGLARPGDLRRAEPATMRELLRVHTPAWLEASCGAEAVARVLGLEPQLVPADEVVSAQRYAAGGTIAAARAAAAGELDVAFNVGGGFHHAEPERGGGFCLYNDVAAAIAALRASEFDEPIAVVDLDYHQGNGTQIAFADDASVLTFSIHGSVWSHLDAVADRGFALPAGTRDGEYLELLRRELAPALARIRPSLVFYVAGTDVLGGDRLGDFGLTPAGVFERDRHVTEVARELGAPIVVTLAGGYSQRAWRSSLAHLTWLLTDRAHAFEDSEGDVATRLEHIARTLSNDDLQREEDLSLTMEDVMGELASPPRQRRLLGFYSKSGLELALERYAFFDVLRGLGFEDFALEMNPSDPDHQVVRLRGRRGDRTERSLLVELVLRLRELAPPREAEEAFPDRRALRLLAVEWMLLQDPTRAFSLRRPPLPGQAHPGLGCAREVLELLAQVCKRLELDGAVNQPGHYHVARFAQDRMKFLDPRAQGRLAAFSRALADRDPAEASRAVAEDRLRLADGTRVAWEPAPFVLPVSPGLKKWLSCDRYRELCDRARDELLAAGLHVEGSARADGPAEPH